MASWWQQYHSMSSASILVVTDVLDFPSNRTRLCRPNEKSWIVFGSRLPDPWRGLPPPLHLPQPDILLVKDYEVFGCPRTQEIKWINIINLTSRSYLTVEDHKRLVKMMMLKSASRVELCQWWTSLDVIRIVGTTMIEIMTQTGHN